VGSRCAWSRRAWVRPSTSRAAEALRAGGGRGVHDVGAILWLGFGADTAADVPTAMLVAAATLESVFALCLGCQVFAGLMRLGVVPEATCERCANIWAAPEATGP
jgi:hypothetical protein